MTVLAIIMLKTGERLAVSTINSNMVNNTGSTLCFIIAHGTGMVGMVARLTTDIVFAGCFKYIRRDAVILNNVFRFSIGKRRRKIQLRAFISRENWS